jgi:hypothetical protein
MTRRAPSSRPPTERPPRTNVRIVVKNLVAEGSKGLQGEFKKCEFAALVQNLNQLVDRVDWKHSLEGLSLFRVDSGVSCMRW